MIYLFRELIILLTMLMKMQVTQTETNNIVKQQAVMIPSTYLEVCRAAKLVMITSLQFLNETASCKSAIYSLKISVRNPARCKDRTVCDNKIKSNETAICRFA